MKRRSFLFIITIMAAFVLSFAFSEDQSANLTSAGDEWTWEPGASNTFEGTIDLSDLIGQNVSVVISTDLKYDDAAEKDSFPVFTVINGKRITMKKQTDTIRCTPDESNPDVSFSGRLRLPEKQHVTKIVFRYRLLNENDQEIRTVYCTIGDTEEETGNNGNAFYITYDLLYITLFLSVSAVLIWSIVLIRYKKLQKCR